MSGYSMRPSAVGLVWYRPETYDSVRAIMSDADKLPSSYEKWFYRAQKTEQQVRRSGTAAVRVHLDIDEFTAHCRTHGLNLDANGRNAYAALVAAKMLKADPRGRA